MLSYTEQTRIYQEVIVGAQAPDDESQEAKDFRAQVAKGVKETIDAGLMPEVPLDWETDLE